MSEQKQIQIFNMLLLYPTTLKEFLDEKFVLNRGFLKSFLGSLVFNLFSAFNF